MLIAASHDRDPPLDPYASGSAAQSLRKASHAPTATVAAVAEDAYQIANDETASVRAAPKAASADGAVSTTAADSTGEGEAPITIVGDTPTTTDYITGYRPPLPSDVTLPGQPMLTIALSLTGMSLLTSEVVVALKTSPQSASRPVTTATKDVTDDARRGARREDPGIHADPRVAAVATMDSVTDAGREWAATRGVPGKLLRVLRGLGGPDGPCWQLPSPTSPAVLGLPPRQRGNRHTFPGMQRVRTDRRSRQKSNPTAQRRSHGRGDGSRTTREAD